MKTAIGLVIGLSALASGAWAQQPGSSPRPDQLEPGVNTSAPAAAAPAPAPARKSSPPPDALEPGVNTSAMPAPGQTSVIAPASMSGGEAAATSSAAPSSTTKGTRGKSTAATGSTTAAGAGGKVAASGATAAQPRTNGSGKASDRIDLDTTQITGNRELPKVLYIVPWKRSDLGDLVGKPVNSLVDEVLQPVDRDVFKRENRYYDALKPDQADAAATGGGASSAQPPAGASKH